MINNIYILQSIYYFISVLKRWIYLSQDSGFGASASWAQALASARGTHQSMVCWLNLAEGACNPGYHALSSASILICCVVNSECVNLFSPLAHHSYMIIWNCYGVVRFYNLLCVFSRFTWPGFLIYITTLFYEKSHSLFMVSVGRRDIPGSPHGYISWFYMYIQSFSKNA